MPVLVVLSVVLVLVLVSSVLALVFVFVLVAFVPYGMLGPPGCLRTSYLQVR